MKNNDFRASQISRTFDINIQAILSEGLNHHFLSPTTSNSSITVPRLLLKNYISQQRLKTGSIMVDKKNKELHNDQALYTFTNKCLPNMFESNMEWQIH